MSWLFGGGGSSGGNNNNNNNNNNNRNNNNDNDNDNDDDIDINENKAKVIADFDPTPLVKGAKALKEIDSSQNAKDVLRLAIQQEVTKQKQSGAREQELMQQNLSMRQKLMQQEHDNQLKQQELQNELNKQRVEEELKRKKALEDYSLQQKQKAQQEWLQQQKQLNEENLQRQKKMEEEIEASRRKTLEYQAKLEQDTAKIKAKAEAEAKIIQERENEDIHLRSQKNRLEEDRKTRLEIRKEELLAYRDFASSVKNLITDEDKMKVIGKAIIGITFGVYASKQFINITGKYIENHLGKPALVRETSRWSWKDLLPNKKWLINRNKWWIFNNQSINADELKGIILEKSTENKMRFIARSTKQTKKNKAPYRHLLIYGPPGTGKTLFARRLARESGLDYAIITGGDFAQLGRNAVTEIHRIFDWSEASKRGTLLFIDEADAFLRRGREGETMSEDMRNALSAFLYRTGTETKNFMLILATNVPKALDKAVLDRIDDCVQFDLPGLDERKKLLEHYFKVYITQEEFHANTSDLNTKKSAPISIKGFQEDVDIWDRLAAKTEGFSGRQIAKYLIHVQAAIYGGMENELTPFLMEQILETFLKSKAFGLE